MTDSSADQAKEVFSQINIEEEVRRSYMDYAMSVIVGRALPDVRDGLKPVHRRILFAMKEMGVDYNKAYKKSARVVGDVIGKYHPHGDSAVYDAIVRMAQPFSLRYTLVDGQGNFGSVDGDPPAAMRYTEVRMSRITHEILEDIDKETVDFVANYDGSEHEPVVLPTRIPNLLVNGASGIAVGMATNIPPHNLAEVIAACLQLIKNPEATISDLMQNLPGPDFPTAGIINGAAGIKEAYTTGRGRIYMRARTHTEEHESGTKIIVTELPYQVNKARLVEKIAELVKEKKLTGIRELRDESDKEGMRVVIELRRDELADVILNKLYKFTQLESVFGINIVALIANQPKLMNLKELLEFFIDHRREVVTRRALFELRKARARAHILEGLAVALENIDAVIAVIKNAANPKVAKSELLSQQWAPTTVVNMLARAGTEAPRPDDLTEAFGITQHGYQLSAPQAQAILELRLQKLTSLEKDNIFNEYTDLLTTITDLLDILSRPERLMQVIEEELAQILERYQDKRKTEIVQTKEDLSMEDMIVDEEVVVTLSHSGYAKSQPITSYRAQKRGGRGKSATTIKSEDFIDKLLIAGTHDTILCFSNRGKVYSLKAYELPMASRSARGKPLINLLPLDHEERINTILPIREFADNKFIFMATTAGTVKKTSLHEFEKLRTKGKRAITLSGDNKLIGVEVTDGTKDIMLFSNVGKVVRFPESQVRGSGRAARGMRGIRLRQAEKVIALITVEDVDMAILTATEHGYGKRTAITDYPKKSRGGMGVISIQTSPRNGLVIGAVAVKHDDEVMLISDQGTLIRTPVKDISVIGRNTQGVLLINLTKDEKLVGLECIIDINK